MRPLVLALLAPVALGACRVTQHVQPTPEPMPPRPPSTATIDVEFPFPEPWASLSESPAEEWIVACVRDPEAFDVSLDAGDSAALLLDFVIMNVPKEPSSRRTAGGVERFDDLAPGTYSVVAVPNRVRVRQFESCVPPHHWGRSGVPEPVWAERVRVSAGDRIRLVWRPMRWPLSPRTPVLQIVGSVMDGPAAPR